jgi:DNA-binding NtrC family response regulator
MDTPRLKIAHLDDSATLRLIVARLLTQAGYEAHSCESWAELQDVVHEHELALVLVDVQMPKLSGAPIALVLKKTRPDLKVVYLSDYDEAHLARLTAETGADGFIRKSFDGSEMLTAIERYLP